MTMRIKAAAVKDSKGVLHTARMHDDTGVIGERGFLLNDGSFVDRYEGMRVARESGQLMDDEGREDLHSRMTMMDDYPDDKGTGAENNNIDEKIALVCCNPLFCSLAERFGRDFKKVYLHIPYAGSFPTMNSGLIGTGLKNVELVDDVFGPHFDEVDIFIFPDLGTAALQIHLEKLGKRVWGPRNAEELEQYRELCKEKMEEMGLPVQPWKVVKGVTALEAHLRANPKQHVKIDKWRGVTETFYSPEWDVVEPKVHAIANDIGGFKEQLEFICEDDLPDRVEVGIDTYCIDGMYPTNTLFGIEAKDMGYVGQMVQWDDIPEPLRRWNEMFAPLFAQYGCRASVSNEVRIGKDLKPYMVDATIRAPSPPSELWQELFTNLSEIVWYGSEGILVEPKPAGKWGVEVLIKSQWAKDNWQAVDYPEKYANQIKLYNCVIIDGKRFVVTQHEDMIEIGAVVGWGDTLEEAVEHAREAGESIKGYNIKFNMGPIDTVNKAIEELEEIGISPFKMDKEEKQSKPD